MNSFLSSLLTRKKLSYSGGFFALCLFFIGCSEGGKVDEKSLSADEKSEMVKTEISGVLNGKFGAFIMDGHEIVTTEFLSKLYSDGNPIWYDGEGLTKDGKTILSFLSKAHYYGLDTASYHTHAIEALIKSSSNEEDFKIKASQIAKIDVLLANGVLLFATHISKGFIDPEEMKVVWKKDSLDIDLVQMVKENNGQKLIDKILTLQPNYFEYQYLITGLKTWLDAHPNPSETVMEFPNVKTDSVGVGKLVRDRLVEFGYLSDSLKSVDTLAVKALVNFQRDHALDDDGKIGKYTLQMLGESEMDRFRRAALALEKWRWKKRSKDFQFRLNIPAYELTIIRNDSIIHRERAVTGTTETQTPELTAKMKWITLHPYWHLPHSISSTEFLYSAKRDSSYMRKAGYQLFTPKNEPVDASTVDFKRLSKDYFPYRVRQNGGYGNSLGLIVFHFPNKHDVYMHDTPSKYLFKRSTRAFSHGCMRLNEPFKIGEFVMKNEKPKDTITADTLKKWALRGFEQRINLKKQIPVEVDYISVSADASAKIIFHLDIYKRDQKYLPLLFPKKAQDTDSETKSTALYIDLPRLSWASPYWSA